MKADLQRFGQSLDPAASPRLLQAVESTLELFGGNITVMSPQVGWLFFKAQAKRPYLDSYGSSEQRGKNSQPAERHSTHFYLVRFLDHPYCFVQFYYAQVFFSVLVRELRVN